MRNIVILMYRGGNYIGVVLFYSELLFHLQNENCKRVSIF